MNNSKSEPAFSNTSGSRDMKKFIKDKMQDSGDLRLKMEAIESEPNPPLPFGNYVPPKLEMADFDNVPTPNTSNTSNTPNTSHTLNTPNTSNTPNKTESLPLNEDTEMPVCKDYFRSTCTRVNCNFRHEYEEVEDPGQVVNNCSEKGYTYSVCQYAHDNVYEEEVYRQTGQLPASAFSHQKHNNRVNDGVVQAKPVVNRASTVIWRKTPPLPPPSNADMPLRELDEKCENCLLLQNRVDDVLLRLNAVDRAKKESSHQLQYVDEQMYRMLEVVLRLLSMMNSQSY